MSNCYKTVADILKSTQSINEFLLDAEKYYAHISKNRNDAPEILATHIELVQKKLGILTVEHNLDPVIDNLINEILIQNNIDELQSCGDYLKKLFVNTIVFHDYGKINENFQAHPDKMNNPSFKGKEKSGSPISTHHSSLGAYLFIVKHFQEISTSFQPKSKEQSVLSACILTLSYPIFKHHGKYLNDNIKDKVDFRPEEIRFMSQYLSNYQFHSEERFAKVIPGNTKTLFQQLSKEIDSFALYSLTRLNFSLLTASDYLASSEYMTGNEIKDFGVLSANRISQIFEYVSKKEWINKDENKRNYNQSTYQNLDGFILQNPKIQNNINLNILRQEMAVEVIQNIRGNSDKNLFYLEAPTGGGKTNLSMLASIELLKSNEKINKVYYVFPFTTLITQTYKAIIETLGLSENEITQLHSKVGFKTKEEDKDGEYGDTKQNFIDNLFVLYPFTLLSHIKFFDIIKTNAKETNYLLHRLANSIVVIDEMQSYNPAHWDKIIYFIKNYAKHYNIKFILMSATLPKLDKLNILKGQVNDFIYLLPNAKADYFKNPNFTNRVSFNFDWFDKNDLTLSEISTLLLEKSKKYAAKDFGKSKPPGSVYTIIEFIFKKSATDFYDIVKEMSGGFFDHIFVLSGSILEHRRKHIINYLKSETNRKGKNLLITTQVVEAGVDIDMDLGFKDKSLIDSEEQLAGRINRNVNKGECILYLFNYNKEKIIYGKDKRYELTNKLISQDQYQKILQEKDFDLLYDIVMADKNEWNKKEMSIGFSEYEDKIKKLRYQSVDLDFQLIDMEQKNISVFVPMQIPISVEGVIDEVTDWVFSKSELSFLAKNGIYPTLENKIDGVEVFDLYINLITNKREFIVQKIAEKTLQGIMSKFVFSIFASKKVEIHVIHFADVEKSNYGFMYLSRWYEFYDEIYGMNDKKFNSNETQFL